MRKFILKAFIVKKLSILAAALVLIGLGFCAYSGNNSSKDDKGRPTVKIGVIAPLSGDNALMGQNCLKGIQFALENIKDSKVDYKLIVEDDANQLANAAKIANKLTNIDNVDVLFSCSSNSGSAAVTYSKNNKRFMITVIASAKEIAAESPYSFLHWTSPEKESEKALEIFKKNDVKKVVVFEIIHGGAETLSDALTKILGENGIDSARYKFQMGERNFNDIVLKASREDADVFMILALPPSIDIIVKTLKQKGIETPYTSMEIPTLIEDRAAFEGVEFVDVTDGELEVIDNYKKKFNTENTYGVAFAYDAIMIINKMINEFFMDNSRIPNSEEMTEKLLNMKEHFGAVGKVTVNPNRMLSSEAVIKKIINGKPITVEN